MTEVAEEVRFDRRPGKKRRVYLLIIEAGHRATIQTKRPRRQHEVRPLQRGIAQGDVLQHVLRKILEPRLRVGVREQFRQLFIEPDVLPRMAVTSSLLTSPSLKPWLGFLLDGSRIRLVIFPFS